MVDAPSRASAASRRFECKMQDAREISKRGASSTVTAVVDNPPSPLFTARVAAPAREEAARKTRIASQSFRSTDLGSTPINPDRVSFWFQIPKHHLSNPVYSAARPWKFLAVPASSRTRKGPGTAYRVHRCKPENPHAVDRSLAMKTRYSGSDAARGPRRRLSVTRFGMQDAREISRLTVVHGNRRSRGPPWPLSAARVAALSRGKSVRKTRIASQSFRSTDIGSTAINIQIK